MINMNWDDGYLAGFEAAMSIVKHYEKNAWDGDDISKFRLQDLSVELVRKFADLKARHLK